MICIPQDVSRVLTMHYIVVMFVLITPSIVPEKINLETLNNYSEFLNFGERKLHKVNRQSLENAIIKSKIDVLGEIFKKNIDSIKITPKLDLIFLIDSSSSVGEANFKSELKFVKKLLSDVTVDINHTRVAIITFGSTVNKSIDEISTPTKQNNKCLLLNRQLAQIQYSGGGTNTLAAFEVAEEIFQLSRNESRKVLFLITDGFSNGGDPVPLAVQLKDKLITIFTIGIQNGNYRELYELASSPGEYYSYLLDSFQEFESLARRALHVDLKSGDYIPLGINSPCDKLCLEGGCCDSKALCTCGTTTGHYSCVCQPGYYGSGLQNSCLACPRGTYSDGPNLCLPCPDMNHITVPPANGIESCTCKTGFQATNKHQCEIVKCPKISTPEHGYFVKKRDCDNVVNSACGVRCEVGYTLVGTSIRLCQNNASWTGDKPSCQIKTCPKLPIPAFGSVSCSHADLGVTYKENEEALPVDTVCNFECHNGKALIGSSQRTCLPLARWDGLKTSCKQIKCPKLAQLKNGKFEPKSCLTEKQAYGQKCKASCNPGYELLGPKEVTCKGRHGSWDNSFESISCRDFVAPNITCPRNISTGTQAGTIFATVAWSHPIVEDNSELPVTTWMKPSIKNIRDFKFELGETKITYFAQDVYKNRAKCSFYVIVKDDERPVIENCYDPPVFLSTDKAGANVSWDDPNIFDNSKNVSVNRSHAFGFFPIGSTLVSYTATDPSGNKNVCYINISIEDAHCEALPDPIYGHSECASASEGMQCIISCEEGFAVPLSQPDSILNDNNSAVRFMCNSSEPIWLNTDGLHSPDCSVAEVPKNFEQNGTVTITSDLDSCNNTDQINELENTIKITLKETSCGGNCTVRTNASCVEEEDSSEERTNIIKREIAYKVDARRGKKKQVNVRFQVKGAYVNKTTNNELANITGFYIHYEKPKFLCGLGFVPRKNRCVQCPKGTFHNASANRCQSCPFSFYNDILAQSQCKSCPFQYSTRKLHSKKIQDCKALCPPGTYARSRILRATKWHPAVAHPTLWPYCRSCPVGYYQPEYGKLHCIACPNNRSTATTRSITINDCTPSAAEICARPNVCNTGTCVPNTDFYYTCNCPDNYIGSHCEHKLNLCDSNPCLNNGFCKQVGNSSGFECACPRGYYGKLCQDRNDDYCILRCLNQGTCHHNDNDYFCICPPGYGGDSCEIKLKYCHYNICENNSTCVEDTNGFRCECSRGLIGRRCSILPCDYKPCPGNKLCVNVAEERATKTSFRCVCPEGFQGVLCEEKIEYCASSPCENGGTCTSNETSYACTCRKLYSGPNCEVKKRTDYVLHFKQYSTSDYIKLDGFGESLDEITACLWMRTRDNFNYGTLLSYATRNYDNAFTITDYTGLVLYVNNQYVVTDLMLNDGFWHHVCISWENIKGAFIVYTDGKVQKSGQGLGNGTLIEGKGNMVIGQEQDIFGGRFSQSETFLGKMAFIDIWSRELTHKEILKHMNDCTNEMFGDLYAWPEIQDNIQGSVEMEDSTFCQTCQEPKTLFQGVINVIDNVAYYECYKGYYLSNPAYGQGRRCNKAAKWEGNYEPFCKKIYCGYPGYVQNAIISVSNFYYAEEVTYKCYEGFTLTGNETIKCTETGKWFPNRPRCMGLQCKAFQAPDNGNLTVMSERNYEEENFISFDVGTQIEIQCIGLANLTGENVLTCLENGTWDFEPGKCVLEQKKARKASKLSCDVNKVPSAPKNGYINLDSLEAARNGTQETVLYECREGYNLSGVNFTMCIIDGYWTEVNMTCSAVTCKLPKYENMVLSKEMEQKEEFFLGNMAKYDCVPGYYQTGDAIIQCQEDGSWNNMFASCQKVRCRKPRFNEDTVIEGRSYFYDSNITIECPSTKTYVLRCNSSGRWEGDKDDTC